MAVLVLLTVSADFPTEETWRWLSYCTKLESRLRQLMLLANVLAWVFDTPLDSEKPLPI